jgi:hypothetical protein
MEDSTPNRVRDSLGGIGGVVHELPPLSTNDWLHLPRSSFNGFRLAYLDAAQVFSSGRFRANSPIHIIMADTLLSGPALVAKRRRL